MRRRDRGRRRGCGRRAGSHSSGAAGMWRARWARKRPSSTARCPWAAVAVARISRSARAAPCTSSGVGDRAPAPTLAAPAPTCGGEEREEPFRGGRRDEVGHDHGPAVYARLPGSLKGDGGGVTVKAQASFIATKPQASSMAKPDDDSASEPGRAASTSRKSSISPRDCCRRRSCRRSRSTWRPVTSARSWSPAAAPLVASSMEVTRSLHDQAFGPQGISSQPTTPQSGPRSGPRPPAAGAGHPARQHLPGRALPGARRHGRRLRGQARAPGRPLRRQAAVVGPGRQRAGLLAVPARGADRVGPLPPQHRQRHRLLSPQRRAALPGDGVPRRRRPGAGAGAGARCR